ncbi:MAG: hypothetical protein ACKV22_41195 [Bryobacteraceae bacterium]
MRTPFLRLEPLPVFHHPRLQPFLDQADYSLVSDPMFHKPNQPVVLESNVEIQNPAHFLPHDPYPQRVQCILLPAPRPESVAETQKVLLPYLAEYFPYSVLDDFILQRRDPQWPLPPIGFPDPGPSRRSCSIRSAMDSPP